MRGVKSRLISSSDSRMEPFTEMEAVDESKGQLYASLRFYRTFKWRHQGVNEMRETTLQVNIWTLSISSFVQPLSQVSISLKNILCNFYFITHFFKLELLLFHIRAH